MKPKKESLAPPSTGNNTHIEDTKNQQYRKLLSTRDFDKLIRKPNLLDSIICRHWLPKTFIIEISEISVMVTSQNEKITVAEQSKTQPTGSHVANASEEMYIINQVFENGYQGFVNLKQQRYED